MKQQYKYDLLLSDRCVLKLFEWVYYVDCTYCLFQAEIGELEAQLVLLRSREAEYTSLIAVEDEKIDAIKQEMAVERERLDNQKAQIDEKQVQLNVEMVSKTCGN